MVYEKNKKSNSAETRPLSVIIIGLIVLLLILSTIAICVGRFSIDPEQSFKILLNNIIPQTETWSEAMYNVVMRLRLPRVLAAILVGGALALAGATYQGIFKNPLVSPDFLGVSSGASVGAAMSILLGMSTLGTQVGAFIGGVSAVFLTTIIPKIMRRDTTMMLVLSGVIISGFMNSIMGLIKYIADPETELAEITYWQMGSISKVTMDNIIAIAPIIIIAGAVLIALRWRINIMSMGENEAKTLGVNLSLERGIAIFCATLITASSVCLSGTIGWIGLVIPHFARLL
ncbi:MAG: FecCD family ABC transporter permease, partial [Intestinibacter sp.]